jgi:hypothetical protein
MSHITKRSCALLFVIILIASTLSACGPSATDYANKVTSEMDAYSKSFEAAMNAVTSAKSADDMKTKEYKDKVAAALSVWEEDGKALGSIPAEEVPADYKAFNDVLVKLSDQTSVSASEVNAALAADNLDQLQTAINNMQKIIDLIDEASKQAPQ